MKPTQYVVLFFTQLLINAFLAFVIFGHKLYTTQPLYWPVWVASFGFILMLISFCGSMCRMLNSERKWKNCSYSSYLWKELNESKWYITFSFFLVFILILNIMLLYSESFIKTWELWTWFVIALTTIFITISYVYTLFLWYTKHSWNGNSYHTIFNQFKESLNPSDQDRLEYLSSTLILSERFVSKQDLISRFSKYTDYLQWNPSDYLAEPKWPIYFDGEQLFHCMPYSAQSDYSAHISGDLVSFFHDAFKYNTVMVSLVISTEKNRTLITEQLLHKFNLLKLASIDVSELRISLSGLEDRAGFNAFLRYYEQAQQTYSISLDRSFSLATHITQLEQNLPNYLVSLSTDDYLDVLLFIEQFKMQLAEIDTWLASFIDKISIQKLKLFLLTPDTTSAQISNPFKLNQTHQAPSLLALNDANKG